MDCYDGAERVNGLVVVEQRGQMDCYDGTDRVMKRL